MKPAEELSGVLRRPYMASYNEETGAYTGTGSMHGSIKSMLQHYWKGDAGSTVHQIPIMQQKPNEWLKEDRINDPLNHVVSQ